MFWIGFIVGMPVGAVALLAVLVLLEIVWCAIRSP